MHAAEDHLQYGCWRWLRPLCWVGAGTQALCNTSAAPGTGSSCDACIAGLVPACTGGSQVLITPSACSSVLHGRSCTDGGWRAVVSHQGMYCAYVVCKRGPASAQLCKSSCCVCGCCSVACISCWREQLVCGLVLVLLHASTAPALGAWCLCCKLLCNLCVSVPYSMCLLMITAHGAASAYHSPLTLVLSWKLLLSLQVLCTTPSAQLKIWVGLAGGHCSLYYSVSGRVKGMACFFLRMHAGMADPSNIVHGHMVHVPWCPWVPQLAVNESTVALPV